MDNGSTFYYKVAVVNSSGTGTLSSVASALLSADIQGSQTNEGHTYALTSSTMSWNSAATAAAAVGGYLATLNTKRRIHGCMTNFTIMEAPNVIFGLDHSIT